MTTMLEDSFNRRCNVTDSVDYGYGDGAPTPITDPYGYGDSSATKSVDKYGYGDTSANDNVSKYGYGDGSPHDTAKYGYGDTSQDDTSKYGYGDASPKDEVSAYGYGDGSPDGQSSGNGEEPHRRPRRRNSVTRYSIVAQDAVKNEFVAHANMIDQLRQGADVTSPPPPVAQSEEHVVVPLKGTTSKISGDNDVIDLDGSSADYASDDGADLSSDKKDKSTKKRRGLGRFLIGRNSSHMSKDSTSSK
jgi:hypothetical protein